MITIIGVDPGLNGAIAVLSETRVAVFDMEREGKNLNLAAIGRHLPKGKTVVCVERVSAAPQQGVASAFNFGKATGAIEGFLVARYGGIQRVPPQVWKRYHGLSGKGKEASRILAIRKFPETAKSLGLKKDHNKAEALLIAVWAQHNRK